MKQRVVLATGVFDLLHQEHIKFLKKAKQAGDWLVVGVESDTRVKNMKGEQRPVNPATQRVVALEKLGIADEVMILPEQFDRPEDHLALVKKVGAKILAVSSHTKHLEAKRQIMNQVGGEVKIVHQHNPAVSSSKLLAKKFT